MKRFGLLPALVVVASIGVGAFRAAGADLDAEIRGQFDALKRDMGDRKWFDRIASQTYRPESLILAGDRDPVDVVLRRTAALLADIRGRKGAPNLSAEADRLDRLVLRGKDVEPRDGGGRVELFADVCRLRRKIALANPLLKGLREILFLKRHPSANHICDQYFGFNQRPGGGVFVLSDPFGSGPSVRNVLAEAVVRRGRLKGQKLVGGAFLSPDLSYDGKTILFAYTQCAKGEKWSPQRSLHIFKAGVDPGAPGGLEQLTDGSWNEFDPCWLPSGRIAFISERRGGFGRCHPRPVPTYTLYSMLPDGRDIVPLSYHETNEWHPSVDHNGMIVYTRWDYVDRGDCIAHHPWITTPDGRDARAIQGNYPVHRNARPDAEMDVRAIPGSRKLVATASPHHGQAYGSIIVIDPDAEDNGAMGPVKRLTPEARFPECDRGAKQLYASPWPLSENYVLCVYSSQGMRGRGTRFGIYLVDGFGNKELLYRDPKISCLSPIPLRPRTRPPVIPHQTEIGFPPGHASAGRAAKPPRTGTITCMNVYNSLLPWPDGTKIKALRIVQLFPKATYRIDRPRIGIASESLARGVIGTVPVEPDGSVHFTAPAGKPFYFQALDADGRAVQSMQSLTYVHPGERLFCQGCHEPSRYAPKSKPPTHTPMALRRPPSRIKPDVDGSFPLLYPRLVQPVLERRCVPCHTQQQKKKKKAPNLAGSTTSFKVLGRLAFGLSGKPPGRKNVRTVPGKFGANAARLYQMLKKGHNNLRLPAAEMYRITLWLDCNSNFYGAYRDTAKQEQGHVVLPQIE